jgi:hypothetical protein
MNWYKNSQLNIPSVLYHGTFANNLETIKQLGLTNECSGNCYPGCVKGVYLTNNKNFAESCAENAENENIPEEYFRDIVILEIDISKLDKRLLKIDPHVNWNNMKGMPNSYIYEGIIPVTTILNLNMV